MNWRLLAVLALLLAAAALPLALDPQGYEIRVLTLCLLFGAMAQAWNIVGGLADRISLGHAAFFGVGAYTSTLLLIHFGLSPWIGMIASAALGAVAAGLISLPTMRLSGHYFALATLAFAEVMRVLANAWAGLTGGPAGISVPYSPESFWMLQFKSGRPLYWIMLGALVAVTMVFLWVRRSPLGWRLLAIRQNEAAAEVVGVDTARAKLAAALISGALTGALGTLYAQFNFFFDPDTVFGLVPVSVRMALIAIVGGMGTAVGPILGAFFLIPLEEFANDLLSARAAGLSQFAFGIVLILVIILQPRGFAALAERWRSRR